MNDFIQHVAKVSDAIGFQAGEPAMELAGQMISVLATNPEHINRFMDRGGELFIDGTFNAENGSLTYRAANGSIQHPSILMKPD
ncbi:hypothetical protein RHIZ_06335 [Rhizobium skierniewicense]|nr:hypothetical protein [Rhizobium skierniewicense]